MNKKLLILMVSLFLTTNVMAQDAVKGFDDKKDLPTLNKILRRSVRRLNAIENGVSLTTGVTGILPLANGGLGSALTDPGADRIMFWDDSAGVFTWLTVGTNLTLTGTTLSADDQGNTSNTIWAWSGEKDAEITETSTTYVTWFRFRFKKIAGISTVTAWARLWNTGSFMAYMNVDIGGASAETTEPGAFVKWATNIGVVDVSGLSDGTTYDGIIQLKRHASDTNVKCSAIVLIGS